MTARDEIINFLSRYITAKDYLEIGCAYNECFDAVEIDNKVGVDPYSGGTLRMTSDDFFKVNLMKFDIVFIDGAHEHQQVWRDFQNAQKVLRPGGYILLHDMWPKSKQHAIWPLPDDDIRPRCGTSWRANFDILALKKQYHIILRETGIGVWRDIPIEYSSMRDKEVYSIDREPLRTEEDSANIPFDKMKQIRDEMPLMTWQDWKAKIVKGFGVGWVKEIVDDQLLERFVRNRFKEFEREIKLTMDKFKVEVQIARSLQPTGDGNIAKLYDHVNPDMTLEEFTEIENKYIDNYIKTEYNNLSPFGMMNKLVWAKKIRENYLAEHLYYIKELD